MSLLTTIFSRRCCGGPVLLLSLALALLGVLFIILTAEGLGAVFMGVGTATLGLCLLLGKSLCTRPHHPRQVP